MPCRDDWETNSAQGVMFSPDLLCGELLCGKRYFAGVLMRAPLGIPLISYVGEFDELRWGIGRTSPRTIFPWFLAEDNPVISSGGE